MRRWMLLLALIAPAVTSPLTAQDSIECDRPDFSEGTGIVPLGRWQVETGFTYSRVEEEKTNSLGEVLVRLPLSARVEARFGLGSYDWTRGGGTKVDGYEDPEVGLKVLLTEGSDRLPPGHPEMALLFLTTVPVGSSELTADAWQPTVKLAMGWDLTPRFSLSSNVNYAWLDDGGESFGQAAASLSAGLSLTDRLGSYLEVFGFSKETADGSATKYLDGGFSYLLSDDLQVDLHAGVGLNDASPDWFVGAGAGVRW